MVLWETFDIEGLTEKRVADNKALPISLVDNISEDKIQVNIVSGNRIILVFR
jgi:hypothetical protein